MNQAVHDQQIQQQLDAQKVNDAEREQLIALQNSGAREITLKRLFLILVLLYPLLTGAGIAYLKWKPAVSGSDWLDAQINAIYVNTQVKDDYFSAFFLTPVLWCLREYFGITTPMADVFARAGVRVAGSMYIVGFALFLAFWFVIWAIALVMLIAIFWIVLHVLDSFSESPGSPKSSTSHGRERHLVHTPNPVTLKAEQEQNLRNVRVYSESTRKREMLTETSSQNPVSFTVY